MTPSAPRSADRRQLTMAALVLVALVCLVYVPPAFRNGFAFDDKRFILDNPAVLHPDGWKGWLAFLHDPRTADALSPHGIVRPLRTLEFALDHALFALSPTAFHLHSVLWHLAASLLALLLLHRLTNDVWPAALGAAVWALHPMHVEAVAWISSRGDVAMGACVFGALLLSLRSQGRDAWLAGALAAGALGMLYKETAIVLPALVFAVRLARPREGAPGRIAPALRSALPFVVLAAAYLLYRTAVQVGETAHANTFVLGGSTAGTFSTMFRGIGAYIATSLLPVRTDVDWYLDPTTSLLIPSALAWLAVILGLVALAVWLRAREPLVAAAIAMFLFPLVPVANWPFQLGIPTAERFLYVSLLGVALIVARAARCRAVRPAVGAAVLGMAVLSAVGTADWKNDDVLMGSALRHDTSPRAHAWFAATGREEAIALDRRAREAANPADRERLERESLARFEEALHHAHRSLALWHRFEKVSHSVSDVVLSAHINAANIALYLDRPGEALWHSDRAIQANESIFPQSHYNRAIALVELGRHAEAIDSIERAFELGTSPDDPTMVRRALEAAEGCLAAGAFDDARRGFRLVRFASPERASVGLASCDAAERDVRAPDAQRALRMASVGAQVPSALIQAVTGEAVRAFLTGCVAEREGDEELAERAFASALASGSLSPEFQARARRALDRIRTGCPAWFDQGVGAQPE